MTVGFVGLGNMGQNMVVRLLEQGVDVVGFNRTAHVTRSFGESVARKSLSGKFFDTPTIDMLVGKLDAPRVIWLMVSAGEPVDEEIDQLLLGGLTKGDTVIDGGNSFYKDSVRRHDELKKREIFYVDCGTSGGLDGARHGACLMLGGDKESIDSVQWLWDRLSTTPAGSGWRHVGPAGAGHFVKMIHNAIEYGMNEAIGEGFEMLTSGPYTIDLASVADLWIHGSIIRGYLLELLAKTFQKDPTLSSFTGTIGGGQTGQWALETAKELGISAKVLEAALVARKKSQTSQTFASKVVSALRAQYGGHKEEEKK
ncbi:decarboxylating 6-phosphogluconate dehydrogenase [Candidatus Gottesmanbacteria bacterium]|nr:decarboxylating 6-phosphogluconate dehydrogenase [Candidatus Gottesmanbacteria bacterium]